MNTNNKSLAEIWNQFEELVLPSIVYEITEALAASNSFRDALQKTGPLIKDSFYIGAEVYQNIMLESTSSKEEKAARLESLYHELNAHMETVMQRKGFIKH